MKKLINFGLVLGAATALAVAAGINPAGAVTISIGIEDVGAGEVSPTLVGSGTGIASAAGVHNNWTFSASGSGSPPNATTDLLGSNAIQVSSGAFGGIFDVFVTVSGITNPNGVLSFLSTFTTNALSAGMTATLSTLLSTTNAIFSGVGLSTATFNGPDLLDTRAFSQTANAGSGPFSLTAVYQVTATGPGQQANDTINIAVPGPVIGAGLPGLIAACGGLIALARRRRQQRA